MDYVCILQAKSNELSIGLRFFLFYFLNLLFSIILKVVSNWTNFNEETLYNN